VIWPVKKPTGSIHYVAARIVRITSDEAGGELFVRVVVESGEEKEIVYGGMYYSQLDKSSEGQTIVLVTEITPEELGQPKHRIAAVRLYEECGADDKFIRDMYRRGNRLYIHFTENGGEYIVLAKRMMMSEARDRNGGDSSRGH
jgi:hypothetical protein